MSLTRDAQFEFAVETGKLTHPGKFPVESAGFDSVRYDRANRASQTVMGLDQTFARLHEKCQWRNDLPSPDPFAEFAHGTLAADRSVALLASADADARQWCERAVE